MGAVAKSSQRVPERKGAAAAAEAVRGNGSPLGPALRGEFEQGLGHDFGAVRIHTDQAAGLATEAVGAPAFTLGRHIVFGKGRWSPSTPAGDRLLAHELTHVIQQSAFSDAQLSGARVLGADHPSERQARTGNGITAPLGAPALQRAPSVDIVKSEQQLSVDLSTRSWRQTLTFKKGQTQVVYVLRDSATGEILKVGKTTVGSIEGRFGEYVAAGNKWGRRLAADVYTLRRRPGRTVQTFEKEMRAGLERMGHRLPWDNTDGRLGRKGKGIPTPKPLPTSGPQLEVIDAAERARQGAGTVEKPPSTPKAAPPPETAPPTPKTAPPPETAPPTPKTAPPPETAPPTPKTAPPPETAPPTPKTAPPAGAPPASKSGPPKAPASEPGFPKGPTATSTKPTSQPTTSTEAKPSRSKSAATKPKGTAPHGGGGQSGSSRKPLKGPAATAGTGVVVAKAMKQLADLAAQNPDDKDLAAVVSTISTSMELKSFASNPKAYVAGKISSALVDSAFGDFHEALGKARESFVAKFPSVATLQEVPLGGGVKLDTLRQDVENARKGLRIPRGQAALIYVYFLLGTDENTPKEEIDRRIALANQEIARLPGIGEYVKKYHDALDRYTFALAVTTNRVFFLREDLGKISPKRVEQLRLSSKAVEKAARSLEKWQNKLLESGLVVFPPGEAAWFELGMLADGFSGVAGQLRSFADLVGRRPAEYDRELERLEAEDKRVQSLARAALLRP